MAPSPDLAQKVLDMRKSLEEYGGRSSKQDVVSGAALAPAGAATAAPRAAQQLLTTATYSLTCSCRLSSFAILPLPWAAGGR
ncbi:hypothetical protein HT031_001544 [Scenedesmus sp. PABB004]|nr:hypothetical protein HT031_001544 [Scenedesmus sp. PABB004]